MQKAPTRSGNIGKRAVGSAAGDLAAEKAALGAIEEALALGEPPNRESPVTPEEKLLRAIFGEKISDARAREMRAASDAETVDLIGRLLDHVCEKLDAINKDMDDTSYKILGTY